MICLQWWVAIPVMLGVFALGMYWVWYMANHWW